MPVPRRFDHIDLRVRNLKKAESFYRKLLPELGFTIDAEIPGWIQFIASHSGEVVEFFGITEDSQHVPNHSRIAFWAESDAEVDRLAGLLRSITANHIEGPDFEAPGYYAVFFEDPSGNRFEICHRMQN